VLWLRDLTAGAGWGLLDHRGEPKVAFHHLRRALAPQAVWSTDEGLSGITVHVANDTANPLGAVLRIALYRDGELRVEQAVQPIELAPHAQSSVDIEQLLGRFVDVSWAYRFGPPQQNVVALTLEQPDGAGLLSQAFRLPAGRPTTPEPAADLGLSASLEAVEADRASLLVSSRRFAYGVRLHVPGFRGEDDAFSVEPGGSRRIALRRVGDGDAAAGSLSALNLLGRVAVTGAKRK
jgi:beta-mannosidase